MAFAHSQHRNLHAHPSLDTRAEHEWIAAMDIDVRLCDPVKSTVADVYFPQVRRSPFTNTSPVSHLDVVSSWKGLSSAQACEMVFWEHVHREALKAQISFTIRRTLAREISLPSDKDFLSRLENTLSFSKLRFVDVDIDRLLDDMLGLVYKDGFPKSTWFAAQRNLPAMVLNFIRTCDCYIEAYPHTFVEVDVSYSLRPDVEILCRIPWQPPPIQFLDMPVSLSPGEEFRICPVYASSGFGRPDFEIFPEHVEFLVASDSLPVKWDAQSRCFRAIVPSNHSRHDSQPLSPTPKSLDHYGTFAKPDLAQALFTTNTTLMFPDKVRYERTARYNIKLEIIKPTSTVGVNEGIIYFHEDANMTMHEPMHRNTAEANCDSYHSLKNLFGLRNEGIAESQLSLTTPPPGCHREETAPEMPPKPALANDEPRLTDQAKVLEQISPKCGASKQVSSFTTFDIPFAFESARLALDQFQHADLELSSKRQRVGQRRDSGVSVTTFGHGDNETFADDEPWYDGEVDSLGKFTTMSSGEAQSVYTHVWTDVEEQRRLPRTKSRAFESGLAGPRVMSSLKRKGSVRRVVFQRPKSSPSANNKAAVQLPSPAESDSDFSEASHPTHDNLISIQDTSDTHRRMPQKHRRLFHKLLKDPYAEFAMPALQSDDAEEKPADWFFVSQGEIKKNFEEFVKKKAEANEKLCSSDEEAYVKIFMQRDDSTEDEDWDMEALSDWNERVE